MVHMSLLQLKDIWDSRIENIKKNYGKNSGNVIFFEKAGNPIIRNRTSKECVQ